MIFLIDTNVMISAALFPLGKVARVVSYILESHEVIFCSFSIEEARIVFQRKFPDKIGSLERFLIETDYTIYETPRELDLNQFPAIRDANDVPILASAILSGADILLTGDKDFQDLDCEKPLVFTPSKYLDLVERKGN